MRWAASDVSPSSHLAFHIPNTCRVLFGLCCVLGLGGLLLCCVFGFLFCKCFGIPNSPRSLDLDDRQGLIASSAMQQKKKNCRVSLDPAGSLNTLPVPIPGKDCPLQTRYVFAYGVDNSDRPSYLLWPFRGGNGQFLLVDPWSGNYFDLEAAKFMEPTDCLCKGEWYF